MDFPIPPIPRLFGPPRLLDFLKISHPPYYLDPPFIKHQRVDIIYTEFKALHFIYYSVGQFIWTYPITPLIRPLTYKAMAFISRY